MRNLLLVLWLLVCNYIEVVVIKGGYGVFNEKKKNKFLELCYFLLGILIINKMG